MLLSLLTITSFAPEPARRLHGRWETFEGLLSCPAGHGPHLQSLSFDVAEEGASGAAVSLRGVRCKRSPEDVDMESFDPDFDVAAQAKLASVCSTVLGVMDRETGTVKMTETVIDGKNGQFWDGVLQGDGTLKLWKVRPHDEAGLGMSVGLYKLKRVSAEPTNAMPDWPSLNTAAAAANPGGAHAH